MGECHNIYFLNFDSMETDSEAESCLQELYYEVLSEKRKRKNSSFIVENLTDATLSK